MYLVPFRNSPSDFSRCWCRKTHPIAVVLCLVRNAYNILVSLQNIIASPYHLSRRWRWSVKYVRERQIRMRPVRAAFDYVFADQLSVRMRQRCRSAAARSTGWWHCRTVRYYNNDHRVTFVSSRCRIHRSHAVSAFTTASAAAAIDHLLLFYVLLYFQVGTK